VPGLEDVKEGFVQGIEYIRTEFLLKILKVISSEAVLMAIYNKIRTKPLFWNKKKQ